MGKLNPYAKALKQIRKKELQDRLKIKKAAIEKAKTLHKIQRAATNKRKAGGIYKKGLKPRKVLKK